MKQLRKTIKLNSKLALDRSWGKAIAIVLVNFAIMILFTLLESIIALILDVPSFLDVYNTLGNFIDDVPNIAIISLSITAGISLFSFIVMVPLSLGVKRWFYSKAGGKTDDIASIFFFFERINSLGKAIWLNISLSVRKLFWALIFFMPNILLTGAIYTMSPDTNLQKIIISLSVLTNFFIFICAVIFYLIFIQKYFLTEYLIIESTELKVSEAIKLSTKYSVGYKQSLFTFHLSFIGWNIVSLLLLPILYTKPYIDTSLAIYARYLIAKNGILSATLNDAEIHSETNEVSEDLEEVFDEFE